MRLGLLLMIALLAMAVGSTAVAETDASVDEGSGGSEPAAWELESDGDAADEGDWLEAEEPSLEMDAEDAADDAVDALESAVDELSDEMADEMGDEMPEPDADPMSEGGSEDVAWDDFDDPEFSPTDATQSDGDEAAASEVAASNEIEIQGSTLVVGGVTLGPVGVDSEGRVGRVHTVKSGDTLWDVSHAYLGTAWVWPSVWSDNSEIENPHVIEPGDKLWISSTEIRAITDDEANEYLASAESMEEPEAEMVAAELPADFEPEEDMEFEDEGDDDFAAAMDDFADTDLEALPVGMPQSGAEGNETGRTVRVAMRENLSFVSDVQLEASTTILGSPSDRKHLSMLDTIYFGLGEGEVEVGDQFTFFRNITDVRSPSTNELLGYHVDVLGWAEVIEVTGETSVAVIRVSIDGTQKGDRAMPRYQPPTDIKVKYPQEDIEGEIAFLPASRTLMGTTDYVFVDVGAMEGVEIGTDLEVYDPGRLEYDGTRDEKLMTPDRVIADLVVVTVQEETAVAFVAHTKRELAVGDAIRGATRDFPNSF